MLKLRLYVLFDLFFTTIITLSVTAKVFNEGTAAANFIEEGTASANKVVLVWVTGAGAEVLAMAAGAGAAAGYAFSVTAEAFEEAAVKFFK